MVNRIRPAWLALALLGGAGLAGCLGDHPVLTDEKVINLGALLSDSLNLIPASRWDVLKVRGQDTSTLFSGSSDRFLDIAPQVGELGDGTLYIIRGYSPYERVCHEVVYAAHWTVTLSDNCKGNVEYTWLETNRSDFILHDTLSWKVTLKDMEADSAVCWVKGLFGRDTMFFIQRSRSPSGISSIEQSLPLLYEGDFTVTWEIVYPWGKRLIDSRYVTVRHNTLSVTATGPENAPVGDSISLYGKILVVREADTVFWRLIRDDNLPSPILGYTAQIKVAAPTLPGILRFGFFAVEPGGAVFSDTVEVRFYAPANRLLAMVHPGPTPAANDRVSIFPHSYSNLKLTAQFKEPGHYRLSLSNDSTEDGLEGFPHIEYAGVDIGHCRLASASTSAKSIDYDVLCESIDHQPVDNDFSFTWLPAVDSLDLTHVFASFAKGDTGIDGLIPAGRIENGGRKVTLETIDTGEYAVRFEGLYTAWSTRGHFTVSPISPTPDACDAGPWQEDSAGNLRVLVFCRDALGRPGAVPFSISGLSSRVMRSDMQIEFYAGDAYMPVPGSMGEYYDQYYIASGPVTREYEGSGRYRILFLKYYDSPTTDGGETTPLVQAEAYGNTPNTCKTVRLEQVKSDLAVDVRCYSPEGLLSHTGFSLRVFR